MATATNRAPNRPVWLVSGGLNWWMRTQFWQCDSHDHRDTIREMQRGDRIAMKTDRFELRRNDEHGNLVSSVGIWAIGKIERTDGRFVFVDWQMADHMPLVNARVDFLADLYPERECVWKINPTEEATIGFVTEIFASESEITQVHEIYAPTERRPILSPENGRFTVTTLITEGCFLKQTALEAMLGRLRTKRNVILQGPPGTGKTWLAKRLAYALIGEKDDQRVRPMQFHPNLSYEDFVRGWRPRGNGELELVDGPFLQAVEDAREDPDNDFVIVIEEINRGNPASIFGEMLTLLEGV